MSTGAVLYRPNGAEKVCAATHTVPNAATHTVLRYGMGQVAIANSITAMMMIAIAVNIVQNSTVLNRSEQKVRPRFFILQSCARAHAT